MGEEEERGEMGVKGREWGSSKEEGAKGVYMGGVDGMHRMGNWELGVGWETGAGGIIGIKSMGQGDVLRVLCGLQLCAVFLYSIRAC